MKTVCITGAAGGIGSELAKRFSEAGWTVGLYDLSQEAVEKLAMELGGTTKAGTLDVTKITEWNDTLAEFVAEFGALDLLINNAGLLESGPFEEGSTGKYGSMLDVNIKGLTLGCYAAHAYLKKSKGMLINLSSASAIYGQPNLAVYSATKFYVRGLTEALSLEGEGQGIRVHDLMPLFVQTGMVKDMDARSIERLGVKLGPKDVAEAAFSLATSTRAPVHTPVGLATKVAYTLTKLVPDQLGRWVNKKIGT